MTSLPLMYPFHVVNFPPTCGSILATPPVIALCCSALSQARYSVVGAVGTIVETRMASFFIPSSVTRPAKRDLKSRARRAVDREGIEPPSSSKILFYRQVRPSDIRLRPGNDTWRQAEARGSGRFSGPFQRARSFRAEVRRLEHHTFRYAPGSGRARDHSRFDFHKRGSGAFEPTLRVLEVRAPSCTPNTPGSRR